MPRARNQYIEEMRERFEVVNVAGRRVDRNFQASNEEKATLTGAEQVQSQRITVISLLPHAILQIKLKLVANLFDFY